jgi:hypothetical protein
VYMYIYIYIYKALPPWRSHHPLFPFIGFSLYNCRIGFCILLVSSSELGFSHILSKQAG